MYLEKVDGFSFIQNEKGLSATRVFIWDDDSNGVADLEDIPKIGDSFPSSYIITLRGEENFFTTNLICRSKEYNFLDGDKRKQVIVCSYSNEPTDTAQYSIDESSPPSDYANLPVNVDYAGEFTVWNPPKDVAGLAQSKWVWFDDKTTKIEEPIPFVVRTATKKIAGVVKDQDYNEVIKNVQEMIGTVNIEGKYFPEEGCWLFTGVSSEIYNNHFDKKTWRVELSFMFRDPDGTSLDGWNKILSKEGDWRVPYKNDTEDEENSQKMYTFSDFDGLVV